MVNLEIKNRLELPIPATLSTSFNVIYDEAPPTFFQGSTMESCDELLFAIKKCDRESDFKFFFYKDTAAIGVKYMLIQQ